MKRPAFLKKGDSIGFVAPAGVITAEELRPGIEQWHEWGYKVILGKHVYDKADQFAGTTEDRADDFQEMLDNPEIKAIFCVRGGYGSIKIIDELKFKNFKKDPKWIVGYSDITVFHSYINESVGVCTIHGPMPGNIKKYGKNNASVIHLRDMLEGKRINYDMPSHSLNREGNAEGSICGGNLSLLYSMRGTGLDIDTNDKILFIEDINENLYHLDRMMMNLKVGGKLDFLKALIVGDMGEMKDDAEKPFGKTAFEIILEAVEDYNYPVYFDFPMGHTENNYPLMMGETIRIINNKLQFI